MKHITNFINETGSYVMYSSNNNRPDNFKDLKQRINNCFDLDQRGKKVFKKGIDDKETDDLLSELAEPQYQMSLVLTSSLKKVKDATIIMKGKVYSVIQF